MTEENTRQITFKVQRFDPEKDKQPHFQEFNVAWIKGDTVLDGLIYIKENLDSTLAFRSSCRMYVCGSCGMLINGYPHLACHSQIGEFNTDKLTLQPLPNLPIIKDLVPALDTMFDNHKAVTPYIIRHDTAEMAAPTDEFQQSPEELNGILQFSYCIKCGLCLAACPTMSTDKTFIGPQALAQCFRYCADSRDDGEKERLPLVSGENGLWHCHLAGSCSEACPKGVDPSLAIQLLKRKAAAQALHLGHKRKPAGVMPPPAQNKPPIPFPPYNVKKESPKQS